MAIGLPTARSLRPLLLAGLAAALLAAPVTADAANPPCPGATECPWNSFSPFPASSPGLKDIADVAVDPADGDVYVTDRDFHRVLRFVGGAGSPEVWGARGGTGEQGDGPGEFSMPEGVAVDPTTGDVYVAEVNGNRVQKFDEDGDWLLTLGATQGSGNGEFIFPNDVAVDPSGNVYVADGGNSRIQKFDSAGQWQWATGAPGDGDGQFGFSDPAGIATDGTSVWATDYDRIQEFNAADGAFIGADDGGGSFSGLNSLDVFGGDLYATDTQSIHKLAGGTWSVHTPSGNTSLTGIDLATVGGNDHVYVANKANPHVDRLTTSFGSPTQLFAPAAGELFRATAVAIDGSGDTWVVEGDDLYHRVLRYDSAGVFEAGFGASGADGTAGSALGEFSFPRDIAGEGSTVYVADGANGRVQTYDGVSWAELSEPPAGFDFPSGIALDPGSNDIYVADSIFGASKVWKYDGSTWTDLALPGQVDGDFAQDVTLDPATDDIYVAIGNSSDSRILKHDGTSGTWTTVVAHGDADGQVDYPRSLAFANGHLLVADTSNSRIQKLTTAGAFVTKWGSGQFPALCGGEIVDPYGIAASTDGNSVYVADRLNWGVTKFSLDGAVTVPDCDTTLPSGLSFSSPAQNETGVSGTPTFSGFKGTDTGDEDEVKVRVSKRVSSTGAFVPVKTLTATSGSDTWSVSWPGADPPLADGEYWVQASQSDAAGNTRHTSEGSANWGARRFTVGAGASAVTPTVTMNGTSQATRDTTPNLSGGASNNADDSANVTIDIYAGSSASGSPVRSLSTPRNNTSWSLSDSAYSVGGGSLPDGVYTAQASQSNPNATPATGHSATRTFEVDTAAPVVHLSTPRDHVSTTSERPEISGTAGSKGGLSSDNDLVFELNRWTGSAWMNVQTWSYPNPTSGSSFSTQVPFDLSPATYHLRAYQSDAAGNDNPQDSRSSRLFTVEQALKPPVLKITSPQHLSSTSQRQPTISGTSDTAGQVRVELHRWTGSTWVVYSNFYANVSNGFWSLQTSSLPDGTYSPIAYQTNIAAQTGTSSGTWFNVDTTPPAKPRITSPANNTKVGTQTPTFSGTADPNAGTNEVYLQLQGYQNGKWVVLKTETLNRSGGNWSFKPTQYKFTEGYFAAFAYQYDAAGNFVSSDASSFQVDLNAKAPDNPGTNNDDCQKTLDYGPFHVEGTCLKREGLTWVSRAKLSFNGLQLQPEGGGAKVVLDPFNLRIAAEGRVKVVLGPAHLCLQDPTRIISSTCFYDYSVGPFVLYEGSFDWSWQGKVQLPDRPQFGLPAWGGVNLPQLPGLGSFNLPNLHVPGWGSVALPDFTKIKGPDIGKLSLPSLNAPNITLPEKYFGNFKFNLPSLSIGSSGSTNILGFPVEGRLGLQFKDQGIYIDAGLKLPQLLGGTVGDAQLFVGLSGNILAKDLHLGVANAPLGPIGFRDISVDFDGSSQLWSGRGIIDLPIPPDGLAVVAGAGFKNGQLVNAEAGFEKNFPIGTSGLFLYGGSVYFKTVPRRIVGGTIALGLGPQIKGASAVRVDSEIQYKFADPGWQSSFRFDGGVKVVGIKLASAYLEIFEEGLIDFGGRFGKDFGNGFKAEAYVDGWIQGPQKRFNVYGAGNVQLGDWFKFDGEVDVSHIGVGGCAHIESWGKQVKFGATYKWSGAFNPMWSSCSISAVKAKKATARVAGATQSVTVPGGEEAYVMGFKGRAGAPEVTLTGPKGETVSTAGNSGLVNKDFLVVHIPEQNLTQVVLHEPGAGAWTVEVDDSSPPVDQVLTAESIPTPKVPAKVTGKAYARTLEYDASDVQPGQRITFSEVGPEGVEKMIREVGPDKGSFRFTPIAGPAGTRTINAVVTEDGLTRFNLGKVASFRATKPAIPAKPHKVRAKRKKGKKADTVKTTWTKLAGATEYRVTVTLNGRPTVFETTKTKLKVPGLYDRSSARISVAGVNAVGQVGKARKAKVAAPKAKHPKKPKKKKKGGKKRR